MIQKLQNLQKRRIILDISMRAICTVLKRWNVVVSRSFLSPLVKSAAVDARRGGRETTRRTSVSLRI
jgi:hypothetical protein